jgi:sulfopyruvate decarboxylase subunit alpha
VQPSVTNAIVEGLKGAGVDFVSYLPDSWLHDVYEALLADPHFQVVLGTNEGECAGICAGAWLGGKRAVLIMENSGLRVACEALARLGMGHGIPVLLLMPFRGDFGDGFWWAQPHGATMIPVLEALRIPYRVVEREEDIRATIQGAWEKLHGSKYHVAVILGGRLCQ